MFRSLRAAVVVSIVAGGAGVLLAQDAPPRAGSPGVPVPKRIKMVPPEYPPAAQTLGLRGIVILELTIDAEGKVSDAKVVRSVPPFDEAAVAAASQWLYEPVKVDGKAIPVILTVPITFALKLPELERAPGIPEMRQGASPAVPASAGDKSATVVAAVALDNEGFVMDAQVKSGEAPWDEALLLALRTWRFAVAAEAPEIAFDVTAVFPPAGSKNQVTLRLTDPREAPPREEAAAPSPAPVADAATPTPAASPSADAAPATTPTPVASPAASAPTPEAPAAPAASPSPVPAPPAATTEPAAPTPAPTPAAPVRRDVPTEVLLPTAPVAPATPPPPPAIPVSAVRDVELQMGVPDLSTGRRPIVPPLARIQDAGGEVRVRFSVDGSGQTSVQQVEGPELLQEAARQMVGSWVFRRTSLERLYLSATVTYSGTSARASVAPVAP